jgi:hypothetical protein
VQHLAAVGRALFGGHQEKLKAWLKPLVKPLKHQSALKLIRQLEEALAALPSGAAQTVAKEVEYFQAHQARRDYRAGGRGGRTNRRWSGGSPLSPDAMPLQASGPVLESGRRRSLAVSGNVLAQRPLAPPLSTLQETEMRPNMWRHTGFERITTARSAKEDPI